MIHRTSYIIVNDKDVMNRSNLKCKNGHKYTKESFFIDSEGTKRCKICIRDNNKKRYYDNLEQSREYNRKNHAKWRKENHEHVLQIERKSDKKRYKDKLKYARKWFSPYIKKLRIEVLGHYGRKGNPVCVCCNESIWQFLTLDHINGNGNKIRKENPRHRAWMLYQYLRKQFKTTGKYPKGYQTLCMNCNLGRSRNEGICPHKEIKN